MIDVELERQKKEVYIFRRFWNGREPVETCVVVDFLVTRCNNVENKYCKVQHM